MLNEQLPSRPKRLFSYTLIFLTVVYPLHPAWGAAMTVADKNTQISQQNNVPIINIATPNGAGISHNKFQQFNVDKQGAVLNNATTNVNSQIAGQVKANANLKGKSANLIINEVTGSSRSELQGKLEVAGKGANVVIANPNGITCNGCSFVNTPAITLTTGKPILDNKGALSAVEVKKGSVIIGANGLNAEAQTYADIISRATELNGQIKAKNLTLMQGTNRVDFQKGTVTPIVGEGAKPSISVDTKALGGMYANQVKLVSTEAGVGVNLSNVQINQNDLTLTVDGKITLADHIQGKKDINVSTKNLHINANANVNAAKDITLATNTLTNNGKVIVGKDMRIFAESVSNTGNNALIQAQDNLWIQKNAKGDLSTLIENKSGTIKTNAGDLVIRTKQLTNKRAQFNTAFVNHQKTNKFPNLYILGPDPTMDPNDPAYLPQDIYNIKKPTDITEWVGGFDLKTSPYIQLSGKTAQLIASSSPAIIQSGKNAYINGNNIINENSKIHAANNLILTGNTLVNQSDVIGTEKLLREYDSEKFKSVAREDIETGIYKRFRSVTYYDINVDLKSQGDHKKWSIDKYENGQITSHENIVFDFKDKVDFITKNAFNYDDRGSVENFEYNNILNSKNVLINGGNVAINGAMNATNDISIIANKITLLTAQLTTKNSISLVSLNDIDAKQSQFKSTALQFISKNGNIFISNLKPLFMDKNGNSLPTKLDAPTHILLSAGQNISLNNVQLLKTKDIHLTANGNIHLLKNESGFTKLFSPQLKESVPQLLTKYRVWDSSGNITLSSGKDIESQGITFNSGQSLTFNAGQDIRLDPKAIKDVDNVFKTNRYPELRSQLIANGNITLNAARDMNLQSANLQSKDKITALSGRDIKLTATAYSAIPNPHEDNQDVRYVTSTLSGDKGVTLASNGALTTQGSTIKSLEDITISSGGNVRFESVKTHYRKQSGKRLEDLYRQIGTEINSGKTLTILSEGSILFQASRLVAKGSMDIAAKGGYLYAQAMEETSHYEEQKKKCNKWTLCITKKEVKKTRSETKNKVTEFTAGGDINLYAKDDVTLEATKINVGKNAKITSQTGKVNFKAVKNTTFEQVISNSKGFYITQQNKGYTEGKWILPSLHIGGKLTVDANKGITADIKTKEGQSFEQALTILSRTPGYEWLGDIKNNKNVNWAVVKDAYSQWNKKTESLNPVVGAVIAIAAAAATYGTSAAASIGGMASTAASSTATAAGATTATATTVGSIAAASAQAGFAALASQASVALVENKGNLSKTLNSLGKNDTVKSIITQMVISGALNGLDAKMGWTTGNPADAKLPLLSNGDWNKVAQRVAAQSVISSTVNTTIQGGSFTDNFKTALLNNIGNQVNAEGVKLIGDKGELLTEAGKTIPHAAVAAISAEISNSNVRGAIVGVLAAQIAGITINDNLDKTDNWQEQQAQISRVAGAFAGLIATGKASGINSAANSAEIVERYNRQLHLEEIKAVNELANGDKNKLERLLASSCRKVNCIAQESLESSDRAYYESLMKKYPSTYIEDSLLADYWITKERKVVGNYPAFGGMESIQLFTYSKIDSSVDVENFIFNQWIENASNYTGWSRKNLEDLYFATTIGAMAISRNKTNNIHKPLSIGSTGRNIPRTLNEKLALEQAMSNPTAGRQLPVPMTDKRWPGSEGWVKMSQNINGIEVHYVRNTKTGDIDDFKFK